jgi:hypothetical protein
MGCVLRLAKMIPRLLWFSGFAKDRIRWWSMRGRQNELTAGRAYVLAFGCMQAVVDRANTSLSGKVCLFNPLNNNFRSILQGANTALFLLLRYQLLSQNPSSSILLKSLILDRPLPNQICMLRSIAGCRKANLCK